MNTLNHQTKNILSKILQVCAEWEKEDRQLDDVKTSSSRCFKETGYTCAKAYYMPCTANYDQDGNVIEGQEMMCPENFK